MQIQTALGKYIKSRLNELVKEVNARLDGENPEEEEFEVAKSYMNGRTSEPCYKDSDFKTKTGSLDPYEICQCLGIVTNSSGKKAYIVKYKINNTTSEALGFVKFNGGVE